MKQHKNLSDIKIYQAAQDSCKEMGGNLWLGILKPKSEKDTGQYLAWRIPALAGDDVIIWLAPKP